MELLNWKYISLLIYLLTKNVNKMGLKHSEENRSQTKLIVISKRGGKFYVKFPRLEVLVEMTSQYFQQLIASGRYSVQYDVNFVSI